MATSVDWATKVISVPKADLTLVSGTLYRMDTEAWRLELKALEASVEGMPEVDTHQHFTEVTVAGTTYARSISIINGYTVEFEDGQYAVRLDGSNNNIFDEGILVRNQVSVIPTNAAGLIRSSDVNAELLRKVFLNRAVTQEDTPSAGQKTITFYDDDQVTALDSIVISADGNERTNP